MGKSRFFLKKLMFLLLLLPFVLLSCDDLNVITGDDSDVMEDLNNAKTTVYTFYEEKPDETIIPKNISRRFKIGSVLTDEMLVTMSPKPGYDSLGWKLITDADTPPKNITTNDGTTESSIKSVSVTLKDLAFYSTGFTPRHDTPYTVKHYKQNTDLSTFTLAETEKKQGTTDTEIDLDVCKKEFYGFEFGSCSDVTLIAGEGTAVFEIFYTRKDITLTFVSEAGTFTDEPAATSVQVTGKYETPITFPIMSRDCYKLIGFKEFDTEKILDKLETYPGEDKTYELLWKPVYAEGGILPPTDPGYTFKLMKNGKTALSDGDEIANGDVLTFKVYDGSKEISVSIRTFRLLQNGTEIISTSGSYGSSYDSITIPAHLAVSGGNIDVYMAIYQNNIVFDKTVSLVVKKMPMDDYMDLLEFLSTHTGRQSVSFSVSSNSELQLLANVLKSTALTVDGIDLELTGSISSIPYEAFYNCKKLVSIKLPENLNEIQSYAFNGCTLLETVHIPKTTSYLSSSSFSNCPALEEINIDSENPYFISDDRVLFDKQKTTLIQYIDLSTRTEYTIPSSVTKISYNAFYNCENLESITIPGSVGTIPEYAFQSCKNLKSVTIEDGVKTINSYGFYGCENLTSVSIPKSVSSLNGASFSFCNKLESLDIDMGNDNYTTVDGVVFNKEKTKLVLYPAGITATSYTIPNDVTEIGDRAFYYNQKLTSITIPNTVTKIGDYSFYNCKLTSVTIPNSVTSIGSYAFCDCQNLTSITLSNSLTKIPSYLFEYCYGLTSITIPESVTQIESSAFYGCNSLTSITFADTENWYMDPYSSLQYTMLIDVTNATNNATNLATYSGYWQNMYLHKKPEDPSGGGTP